MRGVWLNTDATDAPWHEYSSFLLLIALPLQLDICSGKQTVEIVETRIFFLKHLARLA